MSELNKVHDHQSVTEEITALRNENAMLKEEPALIQQQMEWMKKQIFGRKTEQTSVIMDDGSQLSMFSEETDKAAHVKVFLWIISANV